MNNNLVSKYGYKRYSPFKHSPSLKINTPNGRITMDQVDVPLLALGVNSKEVKVLPPNSGEHQFLDTEIIEKPLTTMPNRRFGGIFPWTKNGFINKFQSGGYTNATTGEQVVIDDTLNSWLSQMKFSSQYDKLPESVKKELRMFANNNEDINNLDVNFIRMAMPETYNLYSSNRGVDGVNIVTQSETGLDEIQTDTGVQDASYVPVPDVEPMINNPENFQKGGYVGGDGFKHPSSIGQYPLTSSTTLPIRAVLPPNTKIKYRNGGMITEGIVKSYNPSTGKYTLY